MKADRKKMELAMARSCMNPNQVADAAKMPLQTVNRVLLGRGVRPATLGRIAKALGCDPADILEGGN